MPDNVEINRDLDHQTTYFSHMTTLHKVIFVLSLLSAIAILGAMLFGGRFNLNAILAIDRNLRDVAIAVWAFAFPAFFVLEETLFAPKDAEKLAIFMEDQKKARAVWIFVGGVVAVMIGATAPGARS